MPVSPDAATLDDYNPSDGYTNEQEPQCPHCETLFRSEDGDNESVIDQEGESYRSIDETDSGGGPYFCPACWSELETNRLAQEYHDGR